MAVTIRDVAREAGVSVATVSHALTGYTDISVKQDKKYRKRHADWGISRMSTDVTLPVKRATGSP